MDPRRWEQVEQLYHAALARPVTERAAFLGEACAGDEGLQREVEALLDAPATAEHFLTGPALAMAAQMVSDPVASVLTGCRLGVYHLQERIGAGGMGEVYRARDTRLGRDVAIKILPRAFTTDPDRLARFEREARVLAALNHPNICTIHGIEESDGIRGLVMELVDGETLADRIAQARMSSGLPIPTFLDIAMPLADALAAAHQKQITHRDLKPRNVMVSNEGRVKVLDFGLARVGRYDAPEYSKAPTQASITQSGMIVGTIPYMSPEQVEGRPLDARTDLFSLGVLFFEMLSGTRPFSGASSPALMSSILRDTPPSIAERRSDVPEALERLVSRLLEKRPADRVQTARDVFNELRHIQKRLDEPSMSRPFGPPKATPAAMDNLSVAVLPFTVRGADPDGESLAEGLTDEVTGGLSRFGYLRVLSRAAAKALAQNPQPSQARYLLEGQVRSAGSMLRITATLVDSLAGANLWTERYDCDPAAGVFALQDEIAARITATIGDQTGALARSMAASTAHIPYDRQSAAALVVRYHLFCENFRADEHARLRAAFETALEREPKAADGWACTSLLYMMERGMGLNPLPNTLDRQRRAAERAIELDPRSQLAWSAMAAAHLFAKEASGVRAAVQRSVTLNELNADELATNSIFLNAVGDWQDAFALATKAIAMKPHHPGWYHFTTFHAFYLQGDYEQALREAMLIAMPSMPFANLDVAAAAGQLSHAAEARAAVEAQRKLDERFLDAEVARRAWGSWHWNEEVLDRLVEGLEKALAL